MACPTIRVFFGLPQSGGDFFTIGDPVKGQLGGAYGLAGDAGTVLSADFTEVTVDRGRGDELGDFDRGTMTANLDNFTRDYDALNTSSPYTGELRPGKKVTVSVYGQQIFGGVVEDWNTDDTVAVLSAEDALGELGRMEFDEWTTTGGQRAGERIIDVLARPEVNYGVNRSIDTGVSTLQDDTVTWGSNPLNYLQLVAESDYGRFFADRRNTVTFRDRLSFVGATPAATFTLDGTGIDFHGYRQEGGNEFLYTYVGVDRDGGLLQTATAAQAVLDEYRVRRLSKSGLLLDSDSQARSMAKFLLGLYQQPRERVAEILIDVAGLADDVERATVAALDVNDLVRIRFTPRGTGSEIDQTLVVEGLSHTLNSDGEHWLALRTAPLAQSAVFIVGDPVYGRLGNPDVRFAY